LLTDSYNDGDDVLNRQNIAKYKILPYNKQKVTLPRKLEFSEFEILNTTQQTLCSIQNGDIQKLNYSNNSQSEIYFISRDPKHFQCKSNISKSDIGILSHVSSEDLYNRKEEINNTNTTSISFEDNIKKSEHQVSVLKEPSILFTKKSNTVVTKQSLSEKVKKSSSFFKKNRLLRESKTGSSIKIKAANQRKIKYITQKSSSESQTSTSEIFNEISFSDFNMTSHTETILKQNQSKNMYHNEISQNLNLEYYDTQENNMNNWNEESQNNNREEDSTSSINSSTKVPYEINNYEDNKMYEQSIYNTSLPTFSDISIFSSNSTLNSDKLLSIQQKFISWSQDSSNAIHYEEIYTRQNNGTVVYNNTHSEEIQFTSKENITMVCN